MFFPGYGIRHSCGPKRCRLAPLCILALAMASHAGHAHALSMQDVENRMVASPPPLVIAADARARTLREQAGIERALPPPQLIVGIEEIPVDGSSAWRLPPAGDSTAVAGVMQMFPSAQRRALQSERMLADAGVADANSDANVRASRLAVRIAYIDAWQASAAQELMRNAVAEAGMRLDALDAAYRTGRATLADRAGAAAELALARDRAGQWQQKIVMSQSQLTRWIGATDDLAHLEFPQLPEPPAEDDLLRQLHEHPDAQMVQRAVNARAIDANLARAGARPDFRLETRYGWRGNMPDTASIMLGVDLPLATVGRRRQQLAVALRAVEEGEAIREERMRELRADVIGNARLHALLAARLAQFDDGVMKSAQQRVDAALAGYRGGRDALESVIAARLALVDADMQRLDLQADLLRSRTRLLYFSASIQEP